MRQTSLSFDELIETLKAPSPVYPKCLIVNEIGEICNDASDLNHERAEMFLRQLLSIGDEEQQFLAFCWLSTKEEKRPYESSEEEFDESAYETSRRLRQYRENPKNEAIVKQAEESIRRNKEAGD